MEIQSQHGLPGSWRTFRGPPLTLVLAVTLSVPHTINVHIEMPTIIIEGPRLAGKRKRHLATVITRAVAQAYDWPEEKIILILHENSHENVARGGRLLKDQGKRQAG